MNNDKKEPNILLIVIGIIILLFGIMMMTGGSVKIPLDLRIDGVMTITPK